MGSAEQRDVRAMQTPELLRHALDEARALAKAEAAHARAELKLELVGAARAGAMLGAAAGLTLSAVSLLLVAVAQALPLRGVYGLVVVGAVALAGAVVLALLGYRRLPLQPMARTQEGLKRDLAIARGTLS